MMISASTLRDRITIKRKSVTRDPVYGTEVVAWTVLAARIAAEVLDVLPSKGESTSNGLRMSTVSSRVRIRYRTDITPDMRVILHRAQDVTTEIISGPAVIGANREGLEMMVSTYSTQAP